MQKDDPKVEKKINYKRAFFLSYFFIMVLFRLISKWEGTSISFMYAKISRIATSFPGVYIPVQHIMYFYFQ